MLNRCFKDLLLGFPIILLSLNCLAAESLENEKKIQKFKTVIDKIYNNYLTYDLEQQQHVVIIYNDFKLSYENRDRLLQELYRKISDNYKEVFAIAYMNFTTPLNLGFIIVDKDFCPEIKSEINKFNIPKISSPDPDDIYNFVTAIRENDSTTYYVPISQTAIIENNSTIYTTKVCDCVAITFQGISKRTGKNTTQLSHYYRKQPVKEFLKASLEHFNPDNTQVNIISNCYSQHLLNLLKYLRENGFQINGIYVAEIEAHFVENENNSCLIYCHPISMFEICQQSLVVGLHDAKLCFDYDKNLSKRIRQSRSFLNDIGVKEIILGAAALVGIYSYFHSS